MCVNTVSLLSRSEKAYCKGHRNQRDAEGKIEKLLPVSLYVNAITIFTASFKLPLSRTIE